MVLDLVHHGLVTVDAGIYWVRVYAGRPCVVVVTEVPANPGSSVDNNFERIAAHVTSTLLTARPSARWFQCWPKGAFTAMPAAQWHAVRFERPLANPTWHPSSRLAVERLVGGSLADLPDHNALLELTLASGGRLEDPASTTDLEIVSTDRLPPPHCPSRCAHYSRFQQLERDAAPSGAGSRGSVGQAFVATLTPKDYRDCRYHDAGWRRIAAAAVSVVRSCGPRPDEGELASAARAARLNQRDRRWFYSLFTDVLWVSDNGYTNGQHRGCALRASGAPEAIVGRDGPPAGSPGTWTFLGDS